MLRTTSLGGWLFLLCLPAMLACGGAGRGYPAHTASTRAAYHAESEGSYGGDVELSAAERRPGDVYEEAASLSPASGQTVAPLDRYASADPPPATDRADARDLSGPLLIYTATLHMAVFEVRATQLQLVERARSMGGVLTLQTDDRLVVRVPAERFEAFLAGIGELGDVLHRDIRAEDVGEEFRDVAIRIRNLEVTRQRVEALLAQASNVEQALAVQRELERITTELEALRGRQRYLADRISLSTVTFVFQPVPREALEQPQIFRLPFGWLERLGLPSLLEVR